MVGVGPSSTPGRRSRPPTPRRRRWRTTGTWPTPSRSATHRPRSTLHGNLEDPRRPRLRRLPAHRRAQPRRRRHPLARLHVGCRRARTPRWACSSRTTASAHRHRAEVPGEPERRQGRTRKARRSAPTARTASCPSPCGAAPTTRPTAIATSPSSTTSGWTRTASSSRSRSSPGTSPIPMPPSAAKLEELGAVDTGQAAPGASTTTVPGATHRRRGRRRRRSPVPRTVPGSTTDHRRRCQPTVPAHRRSRGRPATATTATATTTGCRRSGQAQVRGRGRPGGPRGSPRRRCVARRSRRPAPWRRQLARSGGGTRSRPGPRHGIVRSSPV